MKASSRLAADPRTAASSPDGDDPAVRHHRDVRAEALDQRHHVRGEDDGAAAGGVAGQHIADDPRGHRVDGLQRLVQQQHRR